jgi:hypothetical protein
MIKGSFSLYLIVLVLLTSTAMICTAQPTPGGFPGMVPGVGPSYPFDDEAPIWPGSQSGVGPSYPIDDQAPNWPGSQSGIGPSDTSGSEHPTEGPQVAVPTYTPSANTGNVLGYLENGQTLDPQTIIANFGSKPEPSSEDGSAQSNRDLNPGLAFMAPPPPKGIQIWAFYKNQWTQGPSAIFLNQQMNIAVRNDQTQFLWGYDSNSWQTWSSWGLRWPGTMFSTFLGDVRGWHFVAMWGSKSGWSNVLPIYVW